MVEQFIQSRKYLKAVTPKTIVWYKCSFTAFDGAIDSKESINRRIIELRERGVSPITINSYLRCVNAYHRWLHSAACSTARRPRHLSRRSRSGYGSRGRHRNGRFCTARWWVSRRR